jgi:hypothetical protein
VGGKTSMATIHTSVKKASPHDGHPTGMPLYVCKKKHLPMMVIPLAGMPLERKNINIIMFYIKVA